MDIQSIKEAEQLMKQNIRDTHLIMSFIYDKCNLYLKPENTQITGSFKVRGAGNKITKLSPEEKAKGVIACSAGNHAQGVALAANAFGIKSIICMPKTAPKIKIETTKKLGAEVVYLDPIATLTSSTLDKDYYDLMLENLEVLKKIFIK